MDRRKFVIDSCFICMAAAIPSLLLSSCSEPKNILKVNPESGLLRIPLVNFGVHDYLIVRTSSIDFDVFIQRNNNEYHALLMKCSHRDAPVQYTSGGLVCNEHGSRFTFKGEVLKEPATKSLTRLPVILENDYLTIKI